MGPNPSLQPTCYGWLKNQMRIDQPFRRFAYIAIGAIPATYTAFTLTALSNFSPVVRIGAIIGTAGLCAATIAHAPPASRNVRIAIAIALVVGLVTLVPWSLLFMFLSIANVLDDHTGEDLGTIQGVLTYSWSTLVTFWYFIGPVAIALHFLFSLRQRRA